MLRDRYTLLLSQYPRVVTNLDLLLRPALSGGHRTGPPPRRACKSPSRGRSCHGARLGIHGRRARHSRAVTLPAPPPPGLVFTRAHPGGTPEPLHPTTKKERVSDE